METDKILPSLSYSYTLLGGIITDICFDFDNYLAIFFYKSEFILEIKGFGSSYTEWIACLNNESKSKVLYCFLFAEFMIWFYKNENELLLLFLGAGSSLIFYLII